MDKLNKKEYKKYVKEKVPKPTYARNIFWAFIVGGLICTLGQVISVLIWVLVRKLQVRPLP